jgi:16S rRNA (guanine527-N7)-methyltransferase
MTKVPDTSLIERRLAERLGDRVEGLAAEDRERLARHVHRVLEANAELHLTSIVDLDAFVERHVGESLIGASMLDPSSRGAMLDLGSGNGYPGLPIAVARPGLRPCLAEASRKKAAFLRALVETDYPEGVVIERQIQRAADLPAELRFTTVVTRAMGNWERVLPRLTERLSADEARVLVWAGQAMERVAERAAWNRRFRLLERRPLPARDRSWVWLFQIQL